MTTLDLLRKEYRDLLLRAGALKRDIGRVKAEYDAMHASDQRFGSEPEPWMFDRFKELCDECQVSTDTIRGPSRKPRTTHCRCYIAWKMYRERYMLNDPPSYPQLTAVMRAQARSHSGVWEWVRMADRDSKFQRPPMEGEYAN